MPPISEEDALSRGVGAFGVICDSNFEEQFPDLRTTDRWKGLSYIVRDQMQRESVGIIETGTCRQPGNWDGDGCATKVWDWLVERKGGWACSVDIDIHACIASQEFCPHVQVVCQDSVTFLRGMLPGPPTLLYLDSFDYPEPIEQRKASMMHQAAELASVYAKLPSGCLIASDDSIAVDHGKPGLTRRLLSAFGIDCVAADQPVCIVRGSCLTDPCSARSLQAATRYRE